MMKMTLWDMNQNEQRCTIRGGGKDEGEDDADDDLEQEGKEKMGEEEEDNDDDEEEDQEEKEDKKTTTTTTTTTITTAIYSLKERHDDILHWFNLEWRISRRRRQWILQKRKKAFGEGTRLVQYDKKIYNLWETWTRLEDKKESLDLLEPGRL